MLLAMALLGVGCRAYQKPMYGSSSGAVDCMIDTGFLTGTGLAFLPSLVLLPITLPFYLFLPWEDWLEPDPGQEAAFARYLEQRQAAERARQGLVDESEDADLRIGLEGGMRQHTKIDTEVPVPGQGVHPDVDDRLWYTVLSPALVIGHLGSFVLGGPFYLLHLPWEQGDDTDDKPRGVAPAP